MLETENEQDNKKAKKLLEESKDKYYANRSKKWLICGIGLFIGAVLGLALPGIYQFLTNSLYDRSAIEGLMENLIGKRNISEAMTDELLLVAYEYNSQQPRFYSKYFSE